MSKPREFAHLIKNKFGSADNINSLSREYHNFFGFYYYFPPVSNYTLHKYTTMPNLTQQFFYSFIKFALLKREFFHGKI